MQASARLSSSSAASRKVIAGVSSATARYCYRTSRGKAHAAPLPAQEPPPKGQKRISLQERRARIAEFVENYRASNDGKFPSMKSILQQVGGSYYTVRDVLGEIKHNHAKFPLHNVKPAPLQGTVEVTDHPNLKDEARVVENQGILEVSEPPLPKDDSEVAQPQGTTLVLSDLAETGIVKDLLDKPDPGDQQKEIEANTFDLKNSEKSLNANDSNASDQSGSDMANEAKYHAREDNPKLEESVNTNTGLLGSLKSFAYGIRNFWKNM